MIMKEDNTVRIVFTGDFVPIKRAEDFVESSQYGHIFNNMIDVFDSADFSITNLEAPLIDFGSPIIKTGPNLKAKEKSIEAVKFAGINMVCLANNHIMDYGDIGLRKTLELCKLHNIYTVGAGQNYNEAAKYKTIELKGKRVSFINICENEWSTTNNDKPGTNPLDEISVFHQINSAKSNSDYVILIIHGGHELYGLPSPRMKKLYRWFIDIGADAVIGHHTHCFCGSEFYRGKPIVYSLGNFVFDKNPKLTIKDWFSGCAAKLVFSDKNIDIELIPFHQFDEVTGVRLYDSSEQEEFKLLCEQKTTIIENDIALNSCFQIFLNNIGQKYYSYLEPTMNKYILAAIKRNILPTKLKGDYKLLLLNLIRCESHREIVTKILSE